MKQTPLEEEQMLQAIHVDDDTLDEDDIVFSSLRFRRCPHVQLPPFSKVKPIPLILSSTLARLPIIA